MKHHINLYGAEFRPRRLWASLPQMALVWGRLGSITPTLSPFSRPCFFKLAATTSA